MVVSIGFGWLTETISFLIKILMTIDVNIAKITSVPGMTRVQFGWVEQLVVCDLITIRNLKV